MGKRYFLDSGLVFSCLALGFCLIITNCLADPSNLDVSLKRWAVNAHLSAFLVVLGGLLVSSILAIVHYAVFSPRPIWIRVPLAGALLATAYHQVQEHAQTKSGQRLFEIIGIDPTVISMLPLSAALLFVLGYLLRVAAGNVQTVRWADQQRAREHAHHTQVNRWELALTGLLLLLLYSIVNNIDISSWVLPARMDQRELVAAAFTFLASLLFLFPTLAVSGITNRWLAMLVWLIAVAGTFSIPIAIQRFVDFADFQLPAVAFGTAWFWVTLAVFQVCWGLVLMLSQTLPRSYSIRMFDPTATAAGPADEKYSNGWIPLAGTVGVTFILLGVNLAAASRVSQRFHLLTFAVSEKSTAWEEAFLVADLLKFIQLPEKIEQRPNYRIANTPIELGSDCLTAVRVPVEQLKDPQWEALEQRIKRIQPPVSIQLLGVLNQNNQLQYGQSFYHLDGSKISLQDLPTGISPAQIILENAKVTANDLTLFPNTLLTLRNCQIHLEGNSYSPLRFTGQYYRFEDCDFDRQGLEIAMAIAEHIDYSTMEQLKAQPGGMIDARYGGVVSLSETEEAREWLLKGFKNPVMGILWDGKITLTVSSTLQLKEPVPADIRSPLLMTDSDGRIRGSLLSWLSAEQVKKHRPETLLLRGEKPALFLAAEQDPELQQAFAEVRVLGIFPMFEITPKELLRHFPNVESIMYSDIPRFDMTPILQHPPLKRLAIPNLALASPGIGPMLNRIEYLFLGNSFAANSKPFRNHPKVASLPSLGQYRFKRYNLFALEFLRNYEPKSGATSSADNPPVE